MTTKLHRLWFATLAGTLLYAPSILADYNTQDVLDAGFAADPGEFDGQALSTAQCAAVQAAIDMIAMGAAAGSLEEKCARGLQKMKDAGRICSENGSSSTTTQGTTLPDGMTGCAGDGMNLSPDILSGPKSKLQALLKHEWVHVGQTAPYPELPAYEAEKKCLTDSGVGAGDADFDFVCCEIDSLKGNKKKKVVKIKGVPTGGNDALATVVIDTPTCSYDKVYIQNDEGPTTYYGVVLGESKLYAVSGARGNQFALEMVDPLSVALVPGLVGPNGGEVLAVGGIRRDTDGVIQYVEVDSGKVAIIQSLGKVIVPTADPISLVFEVINGRTILFALDSFNNAIWRLTDENGNGMPDTVPSEAWATTETFPELGIALAIQPNTVVQNSVVTSSKDKRIQKSVTPGDHMAALFDTNGDGFANHSFRYVASESYSVLPYPNVLPSFGNHQVQLVASNGGDVEVWSADSNGKVIELLGQAVGDVDNKATITLPGELASGEHMVIRDETFYSGVDSVPIRVSGFKSFGETCNADLFRSPIGVLGGSYDIGGTIDWCLFQGPTDSLVSLMIGRDQVQMPLDALGAAGCSLFTVPMMMQTMLTDAYGFTFMAMNIPLDPSLVGSELYGQWVIDANSGITSESIFSNGLGVQVASGL